MNMIINLDRKMFWFLCPALAEHTVFVVSVRNGSQLTGVPWDLRLAGHTIATHTFLVCQYSNEHETKKPFPMYSRLRVTRHRIDRIVAYLDRSRGTDLPPDNQTSFCDHRLSRMFSNFLPNARGFLYAVFTLYMRSLFFMWRIMIILSFWICGDVEYSPLRFQIWGSPPWPPPPLWGNLVRWPWRIYRPWADSRPRFQSLHSRYSGQGRTWNADRTGWR